MKIINLIFLLILFLLLGVSSLFAINSVYALEVNNEIIDLSKSNSVDLVIMGNLNDYQSSTRLILTIISPDGSINDYDVRINGKGSFSETFTITKDWMYGKYTVSGNYGDLDLGSTSFVIETPYDPRIGMITSSKSTEIIEESVDSTEKTIENTVEPSKIPEWVRNIALWYGQRSVSETEFINAIKFLIENKIIVVDTPTISDSISKPIESPSKPTLKPEMFTEDESTEETIVPTVIDPPKESTPIRIGVDVTYSDLVINNKDYVGKTIYLEGFVESASKNSSGSWDYYLIIYPCKSRYEYGCLDWNKIYLIDSDATIPTDNKVTVLGTIDGVASYAGPIPLISSIEMNATGYVKEHPGG